MHDAYDETEYRGCTIGLVPDEDAESPRDWENVGKLHLKMDRYDLPVEFDLPTDDDGDEPATLDELARLLTEQQDAVLVLPVWGYSHSGVAFHAGRRIGSFADPWDSGLAGFIMADDKGLAEFDGDLDKLEACLVAEVETYSQWGQGLCFGYVAESPGGDVIGSCWGFYPDNEDDAVGQAKAEVDGWIADQEKGLDKWASLAGLATTRSK